MNEGVITLWGIILLCVLLALEVASFRKKK